MSRKTPGEVRARTCSTKSPSRSEALCFIDSSKSPSTIIDGSLVNFRCRLSNRHGRPRRMLIWTFEETPIRLWARQHDMARSLAQRNAWDQVLDLIRTEDTTCPNPVDSLKNSLKSWRFSAQWSSKTLLPTSVWLEQNKFIRTCVWKLLCQNSLFILLFIFGSLAAKVPACGAWEHSCIPEGFDQIELKFCKGLLFANSSEWKKLQRNSKKSSCTGGKG